MKLTRMHALTEEDIEPTRTVALPSLDNCDHYLRNCIGISSGYAQVLTREPLPGPEKVKEYGKAIDESLSDVLEFLQKYRVI